MFIIDGEVKASPIGLLNILMAGSLNNSSCFF